ncbi:hypothetical protein ALC60_05469 [Trachymyrmex zeteki]|uniref:Uncharacterized protein n=1 Tax=Mycetomoellerius zeteki TaxID=64791 RepID=A0A151X5E6_9HYME|nr:hypothetical protein ALC60_05469 [Trachymyrmex zeteki]
MVFPKLDNIADCVQSNYRESIYTINARKEKGRRVELRKRFMYRNSRWLLIIYNEVQVRHSGFPKRGVYEIWVSFPLLRTIDCGRV